MFFVSIISLHPFIYLFIYLFAYGQYSQKIKRGLMWENNKNPPVHPSFLSPEKRFLVLISVQNQSNQIKVGPVFLL